jgi:hypothetical protein
MMRLIDAWVCIQAGVVHDPVDEVVHDGGDAIDTALPLVQRGMTRCSHWDASCGVPSMPRRTRCAPAPVETRGPITRPLPNDALTRIVVLVA